MSGLPAAALALVEGYLIGAIPFGLLIGRLAGGVDLREHGSGRIGATNALRTVGPAGAVATFLLDLAKGAVAVVVARWVAAPDVAAWVGAIAGMAAIVGHIRSVFIGFHGGRGVATFAGGMLATAPWALALVAPLALAVIWRWRYVSLGSLVASLAAPFVTAALVPAGGADWAGVALGAGGAALVTAAHADNIARLRAGTERRVGR